MTPKPQTDPALLSAGWGALWGATLAVWLLVPRIIDTHHIRPEGVLQWTVLLTGLLGLFAVTGAYLSFLGGFVMAIAEKSIWSAFRSRSWAYALFSGAVVVAAYVIESFVIQWVSYGSFDLIEYAADFVVIVAFCVAFCGASALAYRWIAAQRPARGPRVLALSLAGATAVGIMVVVVSSWGRSARPPDVGPLKAVGTKPTDVPLLVIGLDGGTWRLLDQAIRSGAAPTLKELVDRGTTGTVEALWPPHWSGAAWAAILTGRPREMTGVYEDLAATVPALPIMQVPITRDLFLNPFYVMRAGLVAAEVADFTPPPRALLRGKPIWQLLHEAGVDTAVVRFRFTYPPDGQAGVVVSDWVGRDQWETLGVKRTVGPHAVAPRSRADELLAPFTSDSPADPNLFGWLLPGPLPEAPGNALLNPINELRIASDIDSRTFDVSESILKTNPVQAFLAVYIGGLDSAEHAFWPYRFPEEFPTKRPGQPYVEQLGPVLDRYVSFFDRRLKRLIDLYAAAPNIVIVSDHGQGAATFATSWPGWHTKDGMFIAAGPSVPHQPERIAVSYYDILPTIVALKGFKAPSELSGRSLLSRDLE